jgi:hypothetical protein
MKPAHWISLNYDVRSRGRYSRDTVLTMPSGPSIWNGCSSSYPLAGSRLIYRSAAGTSHVVLRDLTPFILPPGGYLLLAGAACTGGRTPVATFSTGLAATGGGLAIARGSQILDSMGYGTATNAFVEGRPAPAPPSGSSVSRVPNGIDTQNNAVDFKVTLSTPGGPNQ